MDEKKEQKKPEQRKKRGVVLAGGGAKGAYQAGVFRALREVGYEYDIVSGTSVGALNGACMVMEELELCEELWNNITVSQIMNFESELEGPEPFSRLVEIGELVGAAVKEKSLDQTPLKLFLEKYVDVEKIYASPIDFGLVTMEFPQLKPCYLYKKDIPKEHFIDYLMASSACFPAMKPWEIEGQQYIDGGYCDNLPIQMAVDAGAEEIIAVDLDAIGVKRKLKEEWGVGIVIIEPLEDLGFILSFDEERAKVNIRRGYFDGMKAFGRMEGRDYAFEEGTFLGIGDSFLEFRDRILERILPDGKLEAVSEELFTRRIERRLAGDSAVRRFPLVEVKKDIDVNDYKAFAQEEEWMSLKESDAVVMASAEIAGKIFRISPLECYSKSAFDLMLAEAIGQMEPLNRDSWEGWFLETFKNLKSSIKDSVKISFKTFFDSKGTLKESLEIKEMVENLKKIGDERERTLILMEGIKDLMIKEEKFSLKDLKLDEEIKQFLLLSLSAQVFLEPLIAAIYCLSIE